MLLDELPSVSSALCRTPLREDDILGIWNFAFAALSLAAQSAVASSADVALQTTVVDLQDMLV